MNPFRLWRILSRRVYTASLCATLILVACLTLAGVAGAQVDITVHPAMTKGASTAPVTIIEFSDYQ